MRVIIAEDEPLARSLLHALLDEVGGVEVVGEARTASEAVAMAERLNPDAVFLDIEMPEGNGVGVAHALRSRSSAEVVFVTAHETHAVDAYDLGVADYVLKPVRRPRLAAALDRVRARLRLRDANAAATEPDEVPADERLLWVRTHNGRVRLRSSDIVWIEAARDHVYFHTADHSYLHRITMDEIEKRFGGTGLARVQRSAMVRLDKVAAIRRRGKRMWVELGDATQVPVGPSYQSRTMTLLADIANA